LAKILILFSPEGAAVHEGEQAVQKISIGELPRRDDQRRNQKGTLARSDCHGQKHQEEYHHHPQMSAISVFTENIQRKGY
jgi:hypothetical protein